MSCLCIECNSEIELKIFSIIVKAWNKSKSGLNKSLDVFSKILNRYTNVLW